MKQKAIGRMYKFVLSPLILFMGFIVLYLSYVKTIPLTYKDEVGWIGRTYFYDYFIHGNFKRNIWTSRSSYNEPMLTRYVFGAWIYPQYLKERYEKHDLSFDYIKFLISKGFYMLDEPYSGSYHAYYMSQSGSTATFSKDDIGYPADYIKKYGGDIVKTINLIYYVRTINILLLAASVVVMYYLGSALTNNNFGILISVFYGFNTLLVSSGLKAHSEALFVLLFNAAVMSMITYFIKQKRLIYLLIVALLLGLCVSTKLNGFMLVIAYLVMHISYCFYSDKRTIVSTIAYPLIVLGVVMVTFCVLNPAVYRKPLENIVYLFQFRLDEASAQSVLRWKAYLPTPYSRFTQIFRNFYDPSSATGFNGLYLLTSKIPVNHPVLLILFLSGIIYEIIRIYKGNKTSFILLVTFMVVLCTTSGYLILNWERYYVHLVMFFVLYQGIGLFACSRMIMSFCKKIFPK